MDASFGLKRRGIIIQELNVCFKWAIKVDSIRPAIDLLWNNKTAQFGLDIK